jgi:hypothetical protein
MQKDKHINIIINDFKISKLVKRVFHSLKTTNIDSKV